MPSLRSKEAITPKMFRKLYPTVDQPPRFYGLPKVYKKNTPLRPIVSSIGTNMYASARYLADVLSPLMGSYDVSALFTCVLVDKALEIMKRRLEEDETLRERSTMSQDNIVKLLTSA